MYQLSVFVHLLSAIVWVGGLLFLALVAVPATHNLPAADRSALITALGRRFRTVGWASLVLLIVTGLINSAFHGLTWQSLISGSLFQGVFGQALAIKAALVVLMMSLSAFHDFILGPASARALTNPEPTPPREAATLRRRASWLARVTAILALLVVALAVVLVHGLPALF